MRFLSADLVFPIIDHPLANGILVLDDSGKVEELLDRSLLDYEIPDVETYKGFLCPGFVNAHCHLELSWARGLIEQGQGLDFFLRNLEEARKKVKPEEEAEAIKATGEDMFSHGTVAVGDICNTRATLEYKKTSPIRFHNFCEAFASDPAKADLAFRRMSSLKDEFIRSGLNHSSITPHATYSLSQELFRMITDEEGGEASLMSIHHQESMDEIMFFSYGNGPIADRRALFNPGIEPFKPTRKSPLESIRHHFHPEQRLMLVHNTMCLKEDILEAESAFTDLYWCLCPNANLFIEERIPRINLFWKHGKRLLIGTDSLASNHSVLMLEEIKTISRACPDIHLSELLSWATSNGAEFFGFSELGTFEAGKRPGIVLIEEIDNKTVSLTEASRARLIAKPGHDSIH